MGTRSISVRIDEDLLPQIDEIAARADRSRNWWINDAIRGALAEEAAWQERIAKGARQADAGEFATPDEVEAVFAKCRGPRG